MRRPASNLPRPTARAVILSTLVLSGVVSSGSLRADLLAPQATWRAEGGRADAGLGSGIAGIGDVNGDGYEDVLAVSSWWDLFQAHLFLGSPTGLGTYPAWRYSCPGCDVVRIGRAGDVNGDGYDDFLIGVPYDDVASGDEGRAHLFLGGPGGPPGSPSLTYEGDQPGGRLGGVVGGAGDVNGDGFGDILVSAPGYDGGETDEGRAHLYLGSPSGPSTSPAWTWETDQASTALGAAAAGDVDGDGYDDVLVGSVGYTSVEAQEGAIFLFTGSASGPAASPVWRAEGDAPNVRLGHAAGSAGDVNGDGYGDLFAVALGFSHTPYSQGAVFVWLGGPSGVIGTGRQGSPSNADWSTAQGSFVFASLETAAAAGDVNGDGYDDLVVADPYQGDPNGLVWEGLVMLFLGSPSGTVGTPASPGWSTYGDMPDSLLGVSAGAADVDGDGYDDLVAGASLRSNPEYREGALFEFRSVASGVCHDADGDGAGFPGVSACPGGGAQDCDDSRAAVYPGAPEICDGLDNDCDSWTWPAPDDVDADGDGVPACAGDCNDSDPSAEAPPEAVSGLDVAEIAGGWRFSWTSQAAAAGAGTSYDAYRGLVSRLGPGGDFSTGACHVENLFATSFDYTGPRPARGDAGYFVMRAQNGCPGGAGTYGTPNRDTTIAASATPCL